MASKHLLRVAFALSLLGLVAAGSSCATTHSSVQGADTWLEPSPALARRIEDESKRVPYTHGVERIELIRWFASVGEPAYPRLLELAADPRKDVAIAAFAALGATRDTRLVSHLQAIQITDGPDATDLRLERSRTLLRLGDWSSAPVLIAGLRDERAFTRALCSQALNEATHESFGFDPKLEPAQSEEAVARWEAWWKSRQSDALLPKSAPRNTRTSGD
ncbi:MAG: hypothetical protein IPJ19_13565 [Planctomycetes bacterium]|nr:hypothetical protein [Planctomycetota bacterium]